MTPVRRAANRLLLIGCLAPGSLLAQERVDPIPDGPASIVGVLSPFTGDPDSSRVAKLLADEAAAEFPGSGADHVLIARLWRRAGQTGLALKALGAIPGGGDVADLAAYEAARVMFEAGRDAPGGQAYWSACAAADQRVRAEIAWDLLPVTTPAERESWADLPAGESTCDWLRDFWDERALRMAVSRDERIAMHYRRLAEAYSKYRLDKPRYVAGMSDSFGRPEGLAVDDRGLLMIRMGSPDDDQGCPEEVAPTLGDLPNLLGRCWVYWRAGGYRVFYLSTRDRFGSDLPYGDYRIQENLSQQAEPGTDLFHRYVVNADLPRTTKRQLVVRGPVYRNAKLGLSGTAVGDSPSGDLDRAEYLALGREVREVTRRHTSEVLEQIPDAPDIESSLSLRFEPLRFLNPSTGTWQVWLLNSVRAGDLTPSSESPDATLDAEGRFVSLTGEGPSMEPLTPLTAPVASVPDDAGLPLRGVHEAPSGPLLLTVVIEDLNAPGTGAWHQDTINVPAIGGLPQLSDIAVAQAAGGTWTRDGETFLQVSPAHITNPDGSIHTYFEAYGVRPGTRYDVEFRLAPVGTADRIWRLEPDDLGFRLRFTAEMPGDIGRHHLRLDLSDTEPGEYVLAVRIQDEDTKAYSLPSVTDVFVARR